MLSLLKHKFMFLPVLHKEELLINEVLTLFLKFLRTVEHLLGLLSEDLNYLVVERILLAHSRDK